MKFNLKKIFIIFTLANFLSVFLHVICHYVPFITKELDCVFYLIKILLLGILLRFTAVYKPKGWNINPIRRVFKFSFLCDIIEFYCVIMSGNVSAVLTPIVMGLLYSIKLILEVSFFFLVLKDASEISFAKGYKEKNKLIQKRMNIWIFCNCLIAAMILLLIIKRFSIVLILIYLCIILRTILAVDICRLTSSIYAEEHDDVVSISDLLSIKLSKSVMIKCIAAVCILGISMALRFIYTTSVNNPVSKNGDVFQYENTNFMPDWTGFSDRKYGLHNVNTGKDTGAKYSDRLYFDQSGIAWDYDRHFIDENGNEIIETPKFLKKKRSCRQTYLDLFIEWCCYDYDFREYELNRPIDVYGNFERVYQDNKSGYVYFSNGLACYYSDFYDSFGLIKEDGELLTPPQYRYLKLDFDNPFAIVFDKEYQKNILNKDGKELINDNNENVSEINTKFISAGVIKVTDDNSTYFIDKEGQLLSDDYSFDTGILCGDILCVRKKDDNFNTYVLGENANLLFSSDLYLDYEAYTNSEGKIKCLLVHAKKEGKYGVIDLEGNLLCQEWYPLIKYEEGVYNCYSDINGDTLVETIDVIDK